MSLGGTRSLDAHSLDHCARLETERRRRAVGGGGGRQAPMLTPRLDWRFREEPWEAGQGPQQRSPAQSLRSSDSKGTVRTKTSPPATARPT